MIRMTVWRLEGKGSCKKLYYGSKIFQVSSIQTPKHLCHLVQHLANLYSEQRTENCNGQKRWSCQVCIDGLSGCLRRARAVKLKKNIKQKTEN